MIKHSEVSNRLQEKSPRETARAWLLKELATSPGKCPICGVIHAAYCPQEEWLCNLLASYAMDKTNSVRQQLRELERVAREFLVWAGAYGDKGEALRCKLDELGDRR